MLLVIVNVNGYKLGADQEKRFKMSSLYNMEQTNVTARNECQVRRI